MNKKTKQHLLRPFVLQLKKTSGPFFGQSLDEIFDISEKRSDWIRGWMNKIVRDNIKTVSRDKPAVDIPAIIKGLWDTTELTINEKILFTFYLGVMAEKNFMQK